MAANIVRLYDSTLLQGVEVELNEAERTELFDLNYGPPQATTWSNGFCEPYKDAKIDKVDIEGAKAFIEQCRARKFCQSEPLPDEGLFWAVMFEGEVLELAFDDVATVYLNKKHWSRQDGESGSFTEDEIFGWCKMRHHAEAAGKYLTKAIGHGW